MTSNLAIFFVVEILKSSFTASKLRVKNFCRLESHQNLRFFKAFFKIIPVHQKAGLMPGFFICF